MTNLLSTRIEAGRFRVRVPTPGAVGLRALAAYPMPWGGAAWWSFAARRDPSGAARRRLAEGMNAPGAQLALSGSLRPSRPTRTSVRRETFGEHDPEVPAPEAPVAQHQSFRLLVRRAARPRGGSRRLVLDTHRRRGCDDHQAVTPSGRAHSDQSNSGRGRVEQNAHRTYPARESL